MLLIEFVFLFMVSICMIIGGKIECVVIGVDIGWLLWMFVWMFFNVVLMMELFMVLVVISSEVRMLMLECSSIDRVREKWVMVDLCFTRMGLLRCGIWVAVFWLICFGMVFMLVVSCLRWC